MSNCPHCGDSFTPKNGQQVYCGTICKYRANREAEKAARRARAKLARRVCAVCGEEYTPWNRRSRTCGPECAQALSHQWAPFRHKPIQNDEITTYADMTGYMLHHSPLTSPLDFQPGVAA